jgi:hypothetical protein
MQEMKGRKISKKEEKDCRSSNSMIITQLNIISVRNHVRKKTNAGQDRMN